MRPSNAKPSHLTLIWTDRGKACYEDQKLNTCKTSTAKTSAKHHTPKHQHEQQNASQARLVVYKPHHRSRRNLQGGKPKVAQSVESSEEPQKTPVVSMAPPQSGPGGESVFRTLATLTLHLATSIFQLVFGFHFRLCWLWY